MNEKIIILLIISVVLLNACSSPRYINGGFKASQELLDCLSLNGKEGVDYNTSCAFMDCSINLGQEIKDKCTNFNGE